jgi:hypothetical protein
MTTTTTETSQLFVMSLYAHPGRTPGAVVAAAVLGVPPLAALGVVST